MKLSVFDFTEKSLYFIEKHKRKEHIHTLKRVLQKCFEEICISMHVHFIIYCFVDHGRSQILEYKNVHDIAYPFTCFTVSFACACICIFKIHVVRWKIQSTTLDASLHDRVDHSMRNIWISTPIQHDSTCKLGRRFFFLLFLTGRSRNEISPCSSRKSYMDMLKLNPALTRVSPVSGYLNKSDRPNNHKQ